MDKLPQKIRWDEKYNLGLPVIDNEHRRMFGILNELSRSIDNGNSETVLGSILARIRKYTECHFLNEEACMEKVAYPNLDQHRLLHAVLRQSVLAYQERYQSGERINSVEILNFLSDWLANHIQVEDIKLANWLTLVGDPEQITR